ncbi:hypothetical protein NKJ13_30840 [Mesorhizobium sp. M0174]|uniref:hypothetical protein n=1 Tax=Mesorhizobium sp. M0174 TaxID=2956904 RepID=UPI0033360EB8
MHLASQWFPSPSWEYSRGLTSLAGSTLAFSFCVMLSAEISRRSDRMISLRVYL